METQYEPRYATEFAHLHMDYSKAWIAAHWGVTPTCLQHWANQHEAFGLVYFGEKRERNHRVQVMLPGPLYRALFRYQNREGVNLSQAVVRALKRLVYED